MSKKIYPKTLKQDMARARMAYLKGNRHQYFSLILPVLEYFVRNKYRNLAGNSKAPAKPLTLGTMLKALVQKKVLSRSQEDVFWLVDERNEAIHKRDDVGKWGHQKHSRFFKIAADIIEDCKKDVQFYIPYD